MDLLTSISKLQEKAEISAFACSMNKILITLSVKEREALEKVLANDKISTSAIHDLLIANKNKIGKDSIYKHRVKKCRCPK
jgi:hypothetical protein